MKSSDGKNQDDSTEADDTISINWGVSVFDILLITIMP